MSDPYLPDLLRALAPINADPATLDEQGASRRAERLQRLILREFDEPAAIVPLRAASRR